MARRGDATGEEKATVPSTTQLQVRKQFSVLLNQGFRVSACMYWHEAAHATMPAEYDLWYDDL